MSASPSDPRSCPQCGALNYGGLPRCTSCGADMTLRAPASAQPTAFCGECGAKLEPGLKFCGECGTPVVQSGEPQTAPPAPPRLEMNPASGGTESASRWAPPAAPASATTPGVQSQEKKRFCRTCGAQLKAGARFCRKCGTSLDKAPAMPRPVASKPLPAAKPVATAKRTANPPRTQPPPSPISERKESTGPGIGKKIVRVVVPVASMVVTYFLTNKVLGPMLAQQFGDASRQMVPMIVSMAVGVVARQITK